MLHAISLNIIVKKNSTKTVDPTNFLWSLKRKLSYLRGLLFHFNTLQDVTEIVLDESKGVLISTHTKSVSCNNCFGPSVPE